MLPVTSGNWPCGDALRISQNENKFAHIRQLCSQRKIYYPFGHRHKLIPYGQVLFGAGYNRLTFPLNSGFPETTFTSTAFAWTGGGGVQWKIKPKSGSPSVRIRLRANALLKLSEPIRYHTRELSNFGRARLSHWRKITDVLIAQTSRFGRTEGFEITPGTPPLDSPQIPLAEGPISIGDYARYGKPDCR